MKDWVNWFRQASPYINVHRQSKMVIGLSGETIASTQIEHIVQDLTLMNNLGIELVLVVGARPQISSQIDNAGHDASYHKGMRITEEHHVEPMLRAVGEVRLKLEGLFSSGIEGSPMHRAQNRLLSGNMVMAKPLGVRDGIDYHRTGEVRSVDVDAIQTALKLGTIVMLPTIGYSVTGHIYNLAYEHLAARVAHDIGANKLVFLSENELVDGSGNRIDHMSLSESMQFQTDISSLPHSVSRQLDAARIAGVDRTHLLDSREDGALLQELFTRDGIGTLVNSDDYETMRTADIADVPGVLALIKPLEESGVLVSRSQETIETDIKRYIVDELDGTVIGCAALHDHGNGMGELACLAVEQSYRSTGRGDLLLQAVIEKAESLNLSKLYVLTTQTSQWFEERGFSACNLADLPETRRSAYDHARNSRVYIKTL